MKTLTINLDELSFVLHRGRGLYMHCFLDLENGKILNIPTNREVVRQVLGITGNNFSSNALSLKLTEDKKDRLLEIPDRFDLIIYDLMTEFTRSIEKENLVLADQLWKIIHRGEGYHTFHAVLTEHPGMLRKFVNLKDAVFEKDTIDWLEQNNIRWQSLQKD